jgi:CRISPR-associated endonuclease Cas1/group II intron reverse transcriptase/maturase
MTVELFGGVVEEQMRSLNKQLRSQTYQASPAKGFYLSKKSGGQRLVGISTVRDRILQRYLLQAIYPQLDRALSPVAYAYRPGYSTQMAVDRVMEVYRNHPVWVLKTDIRQFFDRICWAVLMGEVERLGIEPILVRWIEGQLKAGMVIEGRSVPMNQGVLQGGVLSGALANLYLREFDRRCLEVGLPLVRYGDDCLVVTESWMGANRALSLMQGWLEESFLTLQLEKTQIFAPDVAFTFLGFRFAAGQVEAPERATKAIEGSKRRSSNSGGRPPKVCSIVKTPRVQRTGSTDVYWSEPMTTLYVTDLGAYVRVQNKQFQVFLRDELKCSVPVNRVTHIVLFGCSNLSHGAVSLCLLHKIPVLYLSSNGKYFGQLQTTGQAQVKYLIHQVQRSFDEEFVLRQAKEIVGAKLHNSRVLLMRLNRRRKTEVATGAILALAELMELAGLAESLEVLLGYEGQGASLYFPAFASLLKGEWDFERRTRRPPTDPVNSLLSLGYTLLHQNLHSMVEVAGLHTHFGNLHVPRDHHPALVSDLIEEFRALVVDSLVAYLVNKRIFVLEDFTPPDERGGVYLHPDGLKRFLTQWEKRLQTQISHPNSGLKVDYRRCFELQVWEYIRCLTGEQEVYRPMRWKE